MKLYILIQFIRCLLFTFVLYNYIINKQTEAVVSHAYKYPDTISTEDLQLTINNLYKQISLDSNDSETMHQYRSELQYLLYKQALRGGQDE